MSTPRIRKPIDQWDGETIAPGQDRDVKMTIGESYSSMVLQIPLHIRRGLQDGPVVFVTAALHGDEINGTGAIRQLILDPEFEITHGSVILIPVLNLLAFDRHSRYLPDRRDLNRSFPGSMTGSLASRLARQIFDEIVARCDYGIDLHTAAVRRTNYPNIRGDMNDPGVRTLAEAFGTEIIMDGKGPEGALRREACDAGCPTIVMEGGEVWKVEPSILETSVRGVKNVLRSLGMLKCELIPPSHQVVIKKSEWIRAQRGGFLSFHIQPGDLLEKGQPIATNTTLLGREQSVLETPFDSVVIGMTTLPATSPGEPVCHLGRLPDGVKPSALRRSRSRGDGFEDQISEQLASNVAVIDREPTE